MDRKYDEIMEKIEVTPEMRQRILNNIQDMDLSEKKPAKVIRFPRWRQLTTLAACFALLLVGALTLPNYLTQDPLPTEMVGNPLEDIVEVASVQELGQAVGFDVAEVEGLPFTPEETTYFSYWNSMAEITYSGEGQSATYRKAPGAADVSGDSNDYPAETSVRVNDVSVALKGYENYTLATWTDGNYSYSLTLSSGKTDAEWQTILGRNLR
ncbi:MAG: hypothetical protein ACOX81_03060 [Candidatus Heteroscillospira sp.]